MGFLSFLLTLFAVFYLLLRLAPWLLRIALLRYMNKANPQSQRPTKQQPTNTKKDKPLFGEYIDYEEIE